MQDICEVISGIELGQAQTYKNLTVIPLILRNPVINNALLTLDEAGDFVDIREVDADGDVPHLMAINRGAIPVIIPEGSLIRGNKQDRVVIHTVVLNNQPLSLSVRCVEQGRWRTSSTKATKSKFHAYASLRRKAYLHNSNQGEIWRDVDRKGRKMGCRSETGTAEAIYMGAEQEMAGYSNAFRVGADVSGAAFLIDGAVIGVELFPVNRIFGKQFGSIISSYALDAIDKELPEHALTVHEFIRQLETVGQTADGDTLTMKSELIEGKAYLHEDSIIHMATFVL